MPPIIAVTAQLAHMVAMPPMICHGVTTSLPKGTCTIQNGPRISYICLKNT